MGEPNELAKAAQNEARTRPVIGGEGPDPERQFELNKELNQARIEAARKKLNAGQITVEEFEKIVGIRP